MTPILPLRIIPVGPHNCEIRDSNTEHCKDGEWMATLKLDKGDPQRRAEAVKAALEATSAKTANDHAPHP